MYVLPPRQSSLLCTALLSVPSTISKPLLKQLFLCGWQFLYLLPFFYSKFPHPFHASKIFIRAENFTAAEGRGVPNYCLVVTLQTIPLSTALYLPEKPGKWHWWYPAFISAKSALHRWAGKLELQVVENSQRWKRNGSQP